MTVFLCLAILGIGWVQANRYAAQSALASVHLKSIRFQKKMSHFERSEARGAKTLLPERESLGLASASPETQIVLVTKGVFRPKGKIVSNWLSAPLQQLKALRRHEHKTWWVDDKGQAQRSISGASWLIYGTPIGKQRALFIIDNLAGEKSFLNTIFRLVAWFIPLVVGAIALVSWLSFRIFEAELKRVSGFLNKVRITDDLRERLERGKSPELAQLNQQINHMLARIEKGVQSFAEVTDDLGHSLNTPLTNAYNELTLLQRKHPDIDLSAGLEEIKQLRETFDFLIDIAKVRSRSGALEVIDPGQAVHVVGQQFARDLKKKQISHKVDYDPACKVFDRAAQTKLVLHNMYENAIKYTKAGGAIEIVLHQEGETCRLSMTNTPGLSLNDEEKERLGGKFFRGESARKKLQKNGHGLGLHFIRTYMESLDGTMECDVRGERFEIVLSWPMAGVKGMDKV